MPRQRHEMLRRADLDPVMIFRPSRVTGMELKRIVMHPALRQRHLEGGKMKPLVARGVAMLVVMGCLGVEAQRLSSLSIRSVMNMRLPYWGWVGLAFWLRERLRRGFHRKHTEPPLFCGSKVSKASIWSVPKPVIAQNVRRDMHRVFERVLVGQWPNARGIRQAAQDFTAKDRIPPPADIRRLLPQWQEDGATT